MFKKKLKKDIEKKANNDYYREIGLLADIVLSGIIEGGALAKAIITTLSRYGRIKPQEVNYRYKLAQESLNKNKTEVKSVMVKVLSDIMSGNANGSSDTYDYGGSSQSSNYGQPETTNTSGHEDAIIKDMGGAAVNQGGSGSNSNQSKESTDEVSESETSGFAETLTSLNF